MTNTKGLDRYDIKIANRKMILEILEQGNCLSRVQLARHTQMSATSMTRIINELQSLNLLLETDGICVGKGRRSTILSVNPDAFYVTGIFLGRQSVKFCIMNFGMQILYAGEYPHNLPKKTSAAEIAARCRSCYTAFLENEAAGFDAAAIKYGGFSFPGPVDVAGQEIIDSPSFAISGIQNLAPALAEVFGFPLYMENDVRASLFNECCRYQAHRGESVAFVMIDDGLGCAFSYRGEMLRGIHSVAGEIAHIHYPARSGDAEQGLYSCNDMLMSSVILASCREKGLNVADIRELTAAYEQRNPVAVSVVTGLSRGLACLLNLLICMYNPEKIILGGTTAHAAPYLLDLAKTYEDLFFAGSLRMTHIEISSETADEALAGAAVLAVKEYRTRLLENVCSGDGGAAR